MAPGKSWQEKYISPKGEKTISKTVKEAEEKTNVEIIPVLEHSATAGEVSGLHLKFLKSVLALLPSIALSLFSSVILFQIYDFWMSPIYYQIVGLFVFYALFYYLFWHFSYPILPKGLYQLYAFSKVKSDFQEAKYYQTKKKESFLIYGFVRERLVILYGDKPIFDKFNEEEISPLIASYAKYAKKKDLVSAYTETIKNAGELLATEFPKTKDDDDEISNEIVFKDKK